MQLVTSNRTRSIQMGLFDFLKGSGHKLFSNDADANKKIEEHILANNPGIDNLKVNFIYSVAHLSGDASSPEALQKVVLMAGNIQGVESVDVAGIKVPGNIPSSKAVEEFGGTQY